MPATLETPDAAAATPARRVALRQQLLFLSPSTPHLGSSVVAWAFYDGASSAPTIPGDSDRPPYPSVLAAMRDGWRVVQAMQLAPAPAGLEHATSYLPCEYLLERLQELDHA